MSIKEFLPNPKGKDTEGEYIILENNGEETVNLAGWRLKDKSGKTFKLDGTLAPNQELKLPYSKTKISLNNNGESVYLIDAAGARVDELGYSGAAEEGFIVKRKIEITPEIRQEFLEDLPNLNFSVNISSSLTGNLILFMVLVGIILAGIAVWIIRKSHE